jgi:putative ABC transport system ATP-binding protein
MMDNGQIILEVDEEKKKQLTIESLLQEFKRIRGVQMTNDRAILT